MEAYVERILAISSEWVSDYWIYPFPLFKLKVKRISPKLIEFVFKTFANFLKYSFRNVLGLNYWCFDSTTSTVDRIRRHRTKSSTRLGFTVNINRRNNGGVIGSMIKYSLFSHISFSWLLLRSPTREKVNLLRVFEWDVWLGLN